MLEHFDEQRLMRLAVLLVNYGYLDVAHNLLATKKLHAGDRAFLESYLKQKIDRWSVRQLKRTVIPFIDKLALALLYLRKHNSLTFDSDRSWPSR
jgi:3-methyladenine DNA glycosylase AlkC